MIKRLLMRESDDAVAHFEDNKSVIMVFQRLSRPWLLSRKLMLSALLTQSIA
jgi:hypothetical protein